MSLGLAAVFLVGLLGGVHCAGMCGGIVSAISAGVPRPARPGLRAQLPALALHAAYSSGRIASYSFAGAVAGSVGGVGLMAGQALPLQHEWAAGAVWAASATGAGVNSACDS